MIILIGAMSDELSKLKNDLKMRPVINSIINEFITDDQKYVLAWCGIGMSNAAAGLSHLLTKYKNVDAVINIGTAGGINKNLKRGDFVVVEKASFATADSTGFGYKYGQLPQMPEFFKADENLVSKIVMILEKLNKNFVLGNTATSDMFFESHDKVDSFTNKLPFAVEIAEMECASFYQTAYLFNIPVMALKIVSDVIGLPDPNEIQFDKFLPIAEKELSIVTQDFLDFLN